MPAKIVIPGLGTFDITMDSVELPYQNTFEKVGELKVTHHDTDIWNQGSEDDFSLTIEVVAGVTESIKTHRDVVKFMENAIALAVYDPVQVASQKGFVTVAFGNWMRRRCWILSVRPVGKGPWDSSGQPMVAEVTLSLRPIGRLNQPLTAGSYSFLS